ncbi:hypothetical protein D922_02702, partial [Enterococcus faecalis 06-MB-DW-09]
MVNILNPFLHAVLAGSVIFQLIFPLIPIVNAHLEDSEKSEFYELAANSTEIVSLPEYQVPAKEQLHFEFEQDRISGKVNERIDIVLYANHNVGDIPLMIPEAVEIDEAGLSDELAVYPREAEQEWLLSASKKQKQFTIPVSVDQPGSYTIVFGDQYEVILDISRIEAHDEENVVNEKEVEATYEKMIEPEENDHSKIGQSRNTVGIRDFHLTSIFDVNGQLAEANIIPDDLVIIRYGKDSQTIVDGRTFNTNAQLREELLLTNIGYHDDLPLEMVMIPKFTPFTTDFSDLRVAKTTETEIDSPYIIVRSGEGIAAGDVFIEFDITVRYMDSKRTLNAPILQTIFTQEGLRPLQGLRMEKGYLSRVLLNHDFSSGVAIAESASDYTFEFSDNLGTSPIHLVTKSQGSLQIMGPQNYFSAFNIQNWSDIDTINIHSLSIESSPTSGGAPSSGNSNLWNGLTTSISANPSTGYSF